MKVFAAIRECRDEKREWIDTATITYLPELTRVLATNTDTTIPQYAHDNPVVRIGRFSLIEVEA